MKKKENYHYNNQVQDIFNLISYKKNNPIIMGSNAINLKYGADYDLFEIITTSQNKTDFVKEVKEHFQELISRIIEIPNVYFIDFKAGNIKDDGIHWTVDEIKKGYQKNGDKHFDLLNIFDEHSIIKIDVISLIGSYFTPFSNVYEFRYNNGRGINQEKETRDDLESLSKDMLNYKDDGNYMKVLKRLFIIAQVNKNEKLINILIEIFDNDCGKLYKLKSDIDTIVELLNIHYNNKIVDDIHKELQLIKEELSKISLFMIPKTIYKRLDNLCKIKSRPALIRRLKLLYNVLMNIVNKNTKKMMRVKKINKFVRMYNN
jgi:hypothetical protein